jgi:hypothetical protein
LAVQRASLRYGLGLIVAHDLETGNALHFTDTHCGRIINRPGSH